MIHDFIDFSVYVLCVLLGYVYAKCVDLSDLEGGSCDEDDKEE